MYDSVYLDKGIVLYHSLEKVSSDFCLYVLALDDKCYDVLKDLAFSHIVVVSLAEFENEELLKAKANRSHGEYCWTCTSSIIKYLLRHYKLEYCTYIDADMYFYQDPQVLIDEMIHCNASAQIVEHRFANDDDRAKYVGIYCVEFNTFKNDEIGNIILDEWIEDSLDSCAAIKDGIHWGEQKYLDKWIPKFGDKIQVLENLGGGVAPWNLKQYKYVASINNNIVLEEKRTGINFILVFYHFEGIYYKDKKTILAPLYLDSNKSGFVKGLYTDYILQIRQVKRFLEKDYNISYYIKNHPNLSSKFEGKGKTIKMILYYIVHPVEAFHKLKIKRDSTLYI